MCTVNKIQKFYFVFNVVVSLWEKEKNTQKMLPEKSGIWNKPERQVAQEKPYVEWYSRVTFEAMRRAWSKSKRQREKQKQVNWSSEQAI